MYDVTPGAEEQVLGSEMDRAGYIIEVALFEAAMARQATIYATLAALADEYRTEVAADTTAYAVSAPLWAPRGRPAAVRGGGRAATTAAAGGEDILVLLASALPSAGGVFNAVPDTDDGCPICKRPWAPDLATALVAVLRCDHGAVVRSLMFANGCDVATVEGLLFALADRHAAAAVRGRSSSDADADEDADGDADGGADQRAGGVCAATAAAARERPVDVLAAAAAAADAHPTDPVTRQRAVYAAARSPVRAAAAARAEAAAALSAAAADGAAGAAAWAAARAAVDAADHVLSAAREAAAAAIYAAMNSAAAHLARLRNLDPTGRTTHSVTYKPLPGADGAAAGGGGAQLHQEAAVLRTLGLQRNSAGGSVHRQVGVYDVLALSRVTVGVCQTAGCGDLSALNVLGSRAGDFYNATHLPLLTHADAAGTRRPVSMVDEDLLSLGRAAVVDPAWLGGAAAAAVGRGADSWAIRAGLSLDAYSRVGLAGTPLVRRDPLGPPWRRNTVWDPADGGAAAAAGRAKWLQAVAWVFCRPPADSFVLLPRIKWTPISRLAAARDATHTLSQRYDRSVWGAEPPAEPASDSDLVLAFIVVVPEGVALASLLLATRDWRRADGVAVVLTFVAGLVSTAGLVALTVEEAAGRAWRGASLREEFAATFPAGVPLPPMARPLTGVPLYRVETLFLAARLGYRVPLLTGLTAAVAGVYAAIFDSYVRLFTLPPVPAAVAGGAGGGASESPGGGGELADWGEAVALLAAPARFGRPVRALAFSPTGSLLAAAGEEPGVLKLIATADPTSQVSILRGSCASRGDEPIAALAFDPLGDYVLSVGARGGVGVWGIDAGCLLTEADLAGRLAAPTCAAWTPDGASVLVGGDGGAVVIALDRWRLEGGRAVRALSWHPAAAALIVTDASGHWAVIGDVLPPHMAPSDGGDTIGSGSSDGGGSAESAAAAESRRRIERALAAEAAAADSESEAAARSEVDEDGSGGGGRRGGGGARHRGAAGRGGRGASGGGGGGKGTRAAADRRRGHRSGAKGGGDRRHNRRARARVPAAFMPSATPWDTIDAAGTPAPGAARLLHWSLAGTITSTAAATHATVAIEFADGDRRPASFIDHYGYTSGVLGDLGALFAAPASPAHAATVFFRPAGSWAANADWTLPLPRGEEPAAVALGARFAAVVTTAGLLRVLSLTGVQTDVCRLGGSPVTATAAGDRLLVVTASDGGDLAYELLRVAASTGEVVATLGAGPLRLSPRSALRWVGFTEVDGGRVGVYDSAGSLTLIEEAAVAAKGARALDYAARLSLHKSHEFAAVVANHYKLPALAARIERLAAVKDFGDDAGLTAGAVRRSRVRGGGPAVPGGVGTAAAAAPPRQPPPAWGAAPPGAVDVMRAAADGDDDDAPVGVRRVVPPPARPAAAAAAPPAAGEDAAGGAAAGGSGDGDGGGADADADANANGGDDDAAVDDDELATLMPPTRKRKAPPTVLALLRAAAPAAGSAAAAGAAARQRPVPSPPAPRVVASSAGSDTDGEGGGGGGAPRPPATAAGTTAAGTAAAGGAAEEGEEEDEGVEAVAAAAAAASPAKKARTATPRRRGRAAGARPRGLAAATAAAAASATATAGAGGAGAGGGGAKAAGGGGKAAAPAAASRNPFAVKAGGGGGKRAAAAAAGAGASKTASLFAVLAKSKVGS
ncbi:hypothetical protein I4F81_007067 [Pyropia yezoensis]|uniref:Uncharacterized protein n=1 Tax=Pyropia yezoensis TaxID=2788 RepID=A0ACC3C3G9_PYRYE|nr:hypothetical protein I4F81_007067 [Neopyropia yezoensis]